MGLTSKRRFWHFPVAYLFGLLAAGILAVAGFQKAGDPALFIDQITAHQVTPASWSPLVAYFFIVVELLAAAAFVVFVWPRLVFAGTILMMLGFIGVTAWAWSQGNAESCGCFGRLIERSPRDVILEDLFVVATSVFGFLLARGFRTRQGQWRLFLPLAALAVLLTIFGPVLPLDRVIVGVGPGSDLADIALSGLRRPIEEDWTLLAIVGPDCPPCVAGLEHLRRIVAEDLGPPVVAALPGDRATAQAWRMKHLPNFPVASAPERTLRQYHRRLPTTFLLEEGHVRQVWWGRIPTPAEVAAAWRAAASAAPPGNPGGGEGVRL